MANPYLVFYDEKEQSVSFSVNKFGRFVIEIDPGGSNPVSVHLAKESVDFMIRYVEMQKEKLK